MWCLILLYDAIIIARSMCGLAAYSQVISASLSGMYVSYFRITQNHVCLVCDFVNFVLVSYEKGSSINTFTPLIPHTKYSAAL